jgi:uncharacterized protein (TIGR03066 family)
MNALRLVAVMAVAGLVGTGARADDKADYAKKIVGKWELTKVEEGGLPKGTIVDFDKDGKVKVTAKIEDKDLVLEGTYKVEGDALLLTMKMGEEERKQTVTILKLDDTSMHTKNEAGKMSELTKKK